jgi:hypothetical protein
LQYFQPERYPMLIFLQQWMWQPLAVQVVQAVALGQELELVEPQE